MLQHQITIKPREAALNQKKCILHLIFSEPINKKLQKPHEFINKKVLKIILKTFSIMTDKPVSCKKVQRICSTTSKTTAYLNTQSCAQKSRKKKLLKNLKNSISISRQQQRKKSVSKQSPRPSQNP